MRPLSITSLAVSFLAATFALAPRVHAGEFDLSGALFVDVGGVWSDGDYMGGAGLGLAQVIGDYTVDRGRGTVHRASVDLQAAFGSDLTRLVQDLQTVSNIEAEPDLWVAELWYQRSWREGRYSVLAGLRDINAEFFVSETGLLFIHSSFGIQPEASTAGLPTFPETSLGIRFHHQDSRGRSLRAAVFDATPAGLRDPFSDQLGWHSRLDIPYSV